MRGVVVLAVVASASLLCAPVFAQDTAPSVEFRTAVQKFQAGDYREAIAIFREVFKLDPNPFVLFNIGRCYQELGELEDGAKYYERALGLGGLPREARVDALFRLEKLEDELKARAIVREGLEEAQTRVDRASFVASTQSRQVPKVVVVTQPKAIREVDPFWTWLGLGTVATGIASAITGGIFYSLVVSGLDEQTRLNKSYVVLRDEAFATGDQAKADEARDAISTINELAETIERDQGISVVMLGAGASFVTAGIVFLLVGQEQSRVVEPTAFRWFIAPHEGGAQVGGGLAW